MMGPMTREVAEVPVEATFALRKQLLRSDRADLGLRMPDDDLPGAFHLAVFDGTGEAVGVATCTPSNPEFDARQPAYRLRQMAVHPDYQGQRVGSALFAAALSRLRAQRVATLWAESRDTSLGFYTAHGMRAVPERHHTVRGVAYTDVVLDLG